MKRRDAAGDWVVGTIARLSKIVLRVVGCRAGSDCRRFVAVSGSTRLAGRRADQERRMSEPGKSDRWVRRRPPARDLRDLLLDLLTRLVCVRHHNIDPRVTRRL